MSHRRLRGTNGCGDWPCNSIRCPPIVIGGAAISPISAGLWSGLGRSSAPDVIGLNPLHALRNTAPYHISPYAPYSRLYLNELYIDLERLPEFYGSEKAQQQFHAPEFQTKLQALRESRQVDYDAIATAKRTMLDLAYRKFLTDAYSGEEPNLQPKTARAWLLERFIQSEGTPLELYATFQTLEEERRLIQSKSTTWHDWPNQFLTPGQPVREYAKRHRKAHSLLSIHSVGGERTAERGPT